MAKTDDTQREEDLIAKYKKRLEKEFSEKPGSERGRDFSTNYLDFKKEFMPKHLTLYEELCNKSEKLLKVVPDKKKSVELNELIGLCHLNVTPAGTLSFAILSFLAVFVSLSLIGFVVFRELFFVAYALIISALVMYALIKLPEFFANNWRLKASNQMVQSIFFIATYMRHTSNLELAIMFASDHLAPPLSLDLKKVLWDVETEKYDSIKESLDNYLQTWEKWNTEFIEAFHLIEGSLMESSEDRRLTMVDKALDVMLEETYEKMLRYAHELKGPVTMLYMLGIILPILGLVILPLVGTFMAKDKPYTVALYIALIYNITIPLLIYYLGKIVLSKRPTGYGESDISEDNPELKRYKNATFKIGKSEIMVSPLLIALLVGAALVLVGLMPALAQLFLSRDALMKNHDSPNIITDFLFDYKVVNGKLTGPYGLVSAVLSILIPLGIGLGIGIYYSIKSRRVIKIRDSTKQLEDEFASSLFQLGNRLGDGLPAEIAFGKVAEVTKDSTTGEFFELVSINIRKKGMGLKQAIFDPVKGALVYFPSSVIESTMKVLVESARKGPKIASQAMINVSEYIKQIHRVNERLKDLMADIISDMKQQTHILAPAISGIVVGITSMIVTILSSLGDIFKTFTSQSGELTNYKFITEMFGYGIPTYYFQLIVGLYVVEIVYILTILTNGIENGADRLGEQDSLGKNMVRSSLIYGVISLIVIAIFNTIALIILSTLGTGF
ncbi:hypothetical protein HYY72_04185 [Candidatus Woesearchaeota archaeon]|nr:hypothetical protein [Candidatus Woesearchaeota archaeon]